MNQLILWLTLAPVAVAAQSGIAGSTTSAAANPVTAGLLAEYPLDDSDGSVRDVSGNGNNSALGPGAAAPMQSATGVSFNYQANGGNGQFISLPSAIKSWNTVALYTCPYPGPQTTGTSGGVQAQWSQYPVLLGTSDATGFALTGARFIANGGIYAENDGGVVPGGYILSQDVGFVTAATDGFGACSVIVYVRDAVQDHIYVDGVEVSYAKQGGTAYVTPTGGYRLGGCGTALSSMVGYTGTINYAAFWSSGITQAQADDVSQYMHAIVEGRSGWISPQRNSSSANQLIALGDSITSGWASIPYTSLLDSLLRRYQVTNWGISGMNVASMKMLAPVRHLQQAGTGHNVFVLQGGTNDVCVHNYTMAMAWQNLVAIATQIQDIGGQLILMTPPSSVGSCDTIRRVLGAIERQNWQVAGFTALADAGGTIELGGVGASANPEYFVSDQVHLTPTGQQILATLVTNLANALDGASMTNHHTTARGTYSIAWSDEWLDLDASTNDISATLPDCNGMTGQSFVITNISSDDSHSAAVVPYGNQTVDGSNSAITIAAGASEQFTVKLLSPFTGGCTWTASQQ